MNKFKQKFTSALLGRNTSSGVLTAIIITMVVFVNIIINVLTSALGLYIYKAPEDDLSISDASEELFRDAIALGHKVTVTFCMDRDALEVHATGKFVYETAKNFKEKYGDFIELRFVNILTKLYYDYEGIFSEAREFDSDLYSKDMRGEDTAINSTTIIFECGSNYRVLTDAVTGAGFADFFTLDSSYTANAYNGEEVFASMINWVLNAEHGTAYLTVGHGETADVTLYNTLTCAGYYVEEIDLKKSEVPDDAELVIISNPKNDFEKAVEGSGVPSEIERLESYATRGGSFLVFVDPYVSKLSTLEAFIGGYGIAFTKDNNGAKQLVKDSNNAITADGFTLVCEYADTALAEGVYAKIGELGGRVIVRDVAALTLSGNAEPMLVSSSSSVTESEGNTTNSDGNYTVAAYSAVTNDDLTESKIFVIPSVYLTAYDAMITNGYANKNFLYSLFDVFYEKGNMPYGCKSILYDTGTLENLTMGTARLYTALLLLIPAAIATVGAVLIIRRKNR